MRQIETTAQTANAALLAPCAIEARREALLRDPEALAALVRRVLADAFEHYGREPFGPLPADDAPLGVDLDYIEVSIELENIGGFTFAEGVVEGLTTVGQTIRAVYDALDLVH
jgi:hypothetical protein